MNMNVLTYIHTGLDDILPAVTLNRPRQAEVQPVYNEKQNLLTPPFLLEEERWHRYTRNKVQPTWLVDPTPGASTASFGHIETYSNTHESQIPYADIHAKYFFGPFVTKHTNISSTHKQPFTQVERNGKQCSGSQLCPCWHPNKVQPVNKVLPVELGCRR